MPGGGLPGKGGPGHRRAASSWCLEEGGHCTPHIVNSITSLQTRTLRAPLPYFPWVYFLKAYLTPTASSRISHTALVLQHVCEMTT